MTGEWIRLIENHLLPEFERWKKRSTLYRKRFFLARACSRGLRAIAWRMKNIQASGFPSRFNRRLRAGGKRMLLLGGMNNLPDFLLIGAQKAGTDSLAHCLRQHPDLLGAAGEISYFSTNKYHRGPGWYRRQLPVRLDPKKRIFEKTPEYIFCPEVPGRIRESLGPDRKFILILRNPVERAWSAWNHYRKYYHSWKGYTKEALVVRIRTNMGEEKGGPMVAFLERPSYPDFEECIGEQIGLIQRGVFQYDPSFVRRGIYHEQIANFWEHFDRKNLLILESGEFRDRKREILGRVARFLDIAPFDFSRMNLENVHQSDYRGESSGKKARERLHDFFRPHNETLFEMLGTRYDWDRESTG